MTIYENSIKLCLYLAKTGIIMKPSTEDKSTSRVVRNEILTRIMEQGSFTVPDIVDRTGISPTTIAKYVFDMQMSGLTDIPLS